MPSSDSFWEIGQYKRTVRRVDDGAKLCGELCALIKERGEIEAAYAKSLRGWGKRWEDAIAKGPEYGTMETAWTAVLDEAERRADMHTRIKDRLNEEVVATVKTWLKAHFHQKPLVGIKESKDLDEEFRKVQKPWAKLYTKVKKAKGDYHGACKAERSAANNEKNAQGDSSLSIDQQKKLGEKVERCREEREKSKDAYEAALKEINRNNSKYMEDMEMVFERAQVMEAQRLTFFKEMLFGVHKCLDISSEPRLGEIYRRYEEVLTKADKEADLEWWRQCQGPGMAMAWPVFEDYSPELRRIHKAKDKELSNGGVMLIGQRQAEASPTSSLATHSSQGSAGNGPTAPVLLRKGSQASSGVNVGGGGGGGGGRGGGGEAEERGGSLASSEPPQPSSPSPFENDWDAPAPNPLLVDRGEIGVKVVALYDYEALEEDELGLKKGDEFEKLEDEDDQGWCRGRKDGRVGLYPANYASPLST